MMNKQQAIDHLTNMRDAASAGLERFRKNLHEAPLYAMEWSERHFRDAALLAICEDALVMLRDVDATDESVDRMVNHFTRQAFHAARYPSRSTSATSNLAAQAKAEVYAELAESIGR